MGGQNPPDGKARGLAGAVVAAAADAEESGEGLVGDVAW